MKYVKNYLKDVMANKYILVAFMLMLILGQFLLQYREDEWPKLYILIVFTAGVLVLLLCKLDDTDEIARNTFIIIAFLGIANALILPVRQDLDENTHYYHALQIADGKMRIQTDEKNFLMVSPDFLAITKMPSKPEYQSPENTNLYSKEFLELKSLPSNYDSEWLSVGKFNNPVYIPSALGIKVGRLISDKLYISYYLGRIFNLIFYALLAYLAVKTSLNYKNHLFLMATIPYTLWITAGYNYDSLFYGLTLLVFSQLSNFLGNDKSITHLKLLLYEFTCLMLVFCKPPMIILAVLPFFLPEKYFAFSYVRAKVFLMSIGVAFLGGMWVIQETILKRLSLIVSNPNTLIVDNPNIDRLSYFVAHPLYTVGVIVRSFSDVIATIAFSIQNPQPFFINSETMGTLNFLVIITGFLLIFLTFQVKVPTILKRMMMVIVVFITIAVFYAISGDTRVFALGNLHVPGVQGRYHYYILVMLPLLFSEKIQMFCNGIGLSTEMINQKKVSTTLMKMMLLLNFLNTAVAVFGYL